MNRSTPAVLSQVTHGDHCCLVFSSAEERVRMTVPFLAIGLERDERCLYVADPESVERVREGMKSAGINVDQEIQRNRLIMSSERDYLDNGRFNTDKMISSLQQAYDSTMADGFTALRATGDLSWEVGPDQDFSSVIYYETLLDIFFLGKRMVGMCQYSKNSCPPDVVTGILNTHRVAAIDQEICSNFHYVPPELLLEKNPVERHTKRVEWMTSQLRRAKHAEEQLLRKEAELRQAQKMDAIGRLAGGIAHDFNNLLNIMMLASEENDMDQIKGAVQRATSLTRQLLAFSRQQDFEIHDVDLNAAVSQVHQLVARVLDENITVKFTGGRDLPKVRANATHIEQVLLNLMLNARDAMPKGGEISISTGKKDGGVVLRVRDNGSGMSEETRQRIFEPFFTTKGPSKGTGLGLSTVYGIIKQAGGHIDVTSELGKGTEFTIFLPAAAGAMEAPKAAQDLKAVAGGHETVLLVEDQPELKFSIESILKKHKYKVVSCTSPDEALKLIHTSGPIDLLLTDLIMPNMNGYELAEKLRKTAPHLKVLVMSGYFDDRVVQLPESVMQNNFLSKPFSTAQLLQTARKVLDKK